MNITTLCDKINLQPYMKERVLAFAGDADFQAIDELQKGYLVFDNMFDAITGLREHIGEDEDGTKVLACLLKAAVDAYEIYQQKGISDEIYFATMKCFPRYISETYTMTGKWCFDRFWWTTRQVGGHLFRLGELEYEMKHAEGEVFIGVHIPSDADFSPAAVEKSLEEAHSFFAKYYPSVSDAEYRCHSWLMDRQLQDMLGADSNIVSFQNRFEIYDEGEDRGDVLEWLFRAKGAEYSTLPENTSLQRKVKKHLLSGGVMRTAYGRLK